MELFVGLGSKLILVAVLLLIGYVYLLVTNTETAIRLLFNVASGVGRVLFMIAKGLYNVVDFLFRKLFR